MKCLVIIVLVCLATASNAQTILYSSFKQLGHSIKDDGKTLKIKINGQRLNNKKLHYERTFDISGLSASQSDSIKAHVLDSLGIAYTFAKPAINASTSQSDYQDVQFTCSNCSTKGNLEIYGKNFVSTRRIDGRNELRTFPIIIPLSTGEYQLIYYRRKKSHSVKLPFTVRDRGNNTVVIN